MDGRATNDKLLYEHSAAFTNSKHAGPDREGECEIVMIAVHLSSPKDQLAKLG